MVHSRNLKPAGILNIYSVYFHQIKTQIKEHKDAEERAVRI